MGQAAPALPFAELRRLATSLGIEAVACIAPPRQLDPAHLDRMAADGLGDLEWLLDNRDMRLDAAALLPSARSLIVCMFHYAAEAPPAPDGLRLARYAAGKDYHQILRPLLGKLGLAIDAATGTPWRHRAAVDSAPVSERTLARLAGLGWIGRNALLIRPDAGSWGVLGCLLSEAPLAEHRGPHGADRCGTCRRCEVACPTRALVDGRVLSTRCISYLTIEHKGPIPGDLAQHFQGWWFGCDLCQEACPWNRFAPGPSDPRLNARSIPPLFAITADTYHQVFAGSAVRRLAYERFRRNLLVAAWSLGRLDLVALVDEPGELLDAQRAVLGITPASSDPSRSAS